MKKILLLSIFLLFFCSFALADDINSCQSLFSNNIYYVNESFDMSSGNCLNIVGSNVTLDCQGFTIDGINTYGTPVRAVGSEENYTNITVKNCVFTNSNSGTMTITGVVNSLFENIQTFNGGGVGLSLGNIVNNTFTNITIINLTNIGIQNSGVGSGNNFSEIFLYNTTSYGFDLRSESSHNTIINNSNITLCGAMGIKIADSNNTQILNTNISSHPTDAININGANNTIIVGNRIVDNGDELQLSDAQFTTIYNNYFYSGAITFTLGTTNSTWNTTLTPGINIFGTNNIGGNYYGTTGNTGFSQICLDEDDNGFCDNNYTISGDGNVDFLALSEPISNCRDFISPGRYTLSESIIDSNNGYCMNISSSNVIFDCNGYIIDGNEANSYAFYAFNVTNVTIKNCILSDWSTYQIKIDSVNESLIENIIITENFTSSGIYVLASNRNNITNISISDTLDDGILIDENSLDNLINNSNFTNLKNGLIINGNGTLIDDVRIDNCSDYGIKFIQGDTSSNNVTNSYIINNNLSGLYLRDAGNNGEYYIYNNYFNNSINVKFDPIIYITNFWNITIVSATNIYGGPSKGGNFWAFPNGTGFSESCSDDNQDGFCDESYVFSPNIEDFLPLARDLIPPATAPALNETGVNDSDFDGNIELSWPADLNAQTYLIYRDLTNMTNISTATLIANTSLLFYEDESVNNSVEYWYALVSVDSAGNYNTSVLSSSFNATANDLTVPKLPSSFNVSASGATATLTWDSVILDINENNDSNVTYQIWRGTSLNLSASLVNETLTFLKNVTTNTTTDVYETEGTILYYYAVSVFDDAENTNLTLNNASVGNNYGNASLTYTVSDSSSSSSSSGGGGGAPTGAPELNRESVRKTYMVGGKYQFSHGGESHSVTVSGIIENKANITIASTPTSFLLGAGESATKDLDGDGDNDVLVEVISVSETSATFDISAVEEEVEDSFESEVVSVKSDGISDNLGEAVFNGSEEERDSTPIRMWWLWIIIGFGVLLLILGIIYRKWIRILIKKRLMQCQILKKLKIKL